ncbi:3-deoxy-manno-octulosonate cytidylyltransferase [Pelagibacteraceae bacterium]|jgi:3-deoxy-manno-octulosonate cytidylyltransferase (CMP-KDO synthetase)|nr:3-deoxy-manno-octulosonate cytidylyltransferase [Pelagibacteraceae bacterium]
MNEIAIIIPSRLSAKRLPNKPLELINEKEMILHVYDAAKKSSIGDVYVATPDKEIINIVKKYGGNAELTSNSHQTGTDRVFEVFDRCLKRKPKFIINLQGDMPNIDPYAIKSLISHMKNEKCDIGTLASYLNVQNEENNPNVVKVIAKNKLEEGFFSETLDFLRLTKKPNIGTIYHHIGIYAFTNKALIRYVSLQRSKLEIERNLEQLRALDNNMKIDVGLIKSSPLSVDTKDDLSKIKKIMKQ